VFTNINVVFARESTSRGMQPYLASGKHPHLTAKNGSVWMRVLRSGRHADGAGMSPLSAPYRETLLGPSTVEAFEEESGFLSWLPVTRTHPGASARMQ
jgi:hypothetical protein